MLKRWKRVPEDRWKAGENLTIAINVHRHTNSFKPPYKIDNDEDEHQNATGNGPNTLQR